MTSFAEIDLPHNAFYAQKAILHLCVTVSICANLLCTASTTFVSVWGSGKALRGKDGSMDAAVEGMLAERTFIFGCFGVGLITTLCALMSASWILMTREVSFVATLGISWSIYIITRQARRIHGKFRLSKGDTVNFDDILKSSAVPQAHPDGDALDDDGDEADALLIPRSIEQRRGTSYNV